jgi:hypothetical protein
MNGRSRKSKKTHLQRVEDLFREMGMPLYRQDGQERLEADGFCAPWLTKKERTEIHSRLSIGDETLCFGKDGSLVGSFSCECGAYRRVPKERARRCK